MTRGGDTRPLVTPGVGCALCGAAECEGINVPVFTPEGQPRFPRLCQDCIGAVLAVSLQLLGHAGRQVAAIAVSVHSGGRAPVS
jgi:hypothetical protein